jgi:deazaflavin-dependent oxidoreductase (nitroreductase family)
MAVVDSPVGWVNKHIKEYVESDGAEGHEWRPGVYTLLLTTTGKKSGQPRRTALIYRKRGSDYVVVASYGGSPKHPAWYTNLEADPTAQVKVGDSDEFTVTARTATGDERASLWTLMNEVWPDYEGYQKKTDREIPVVVLTPVA